MNIPGINKREPLKYKVKCEVNIPHLENKNNIILLINKDKIERTMTGLFVVFSRGDPFSAADLIH